MMKVNKMIKKCLIGVCLAIVLCFIGCEEKVFAEDEFLVVRETCYERTLTIGASSSSEEKMDDDLLRLNLKEDDDLTHLTKLLDLFYEKAQETEIVIVSCFDLYRLYKRLNESGMKRFINELSNLSIGIKSEVADGFRASLVQIKPKKMIMLLKKHIDHASSFPCLLLQKDRTDVAVATLSESGREEETSFWQDLREYNCFI